MNAYRIWAAALVVVALTAIAGCPTTGDGDGGGGGSGGGGQTTTLTDAQQADIDSVAAQLQSLAAAINAFIGLTDPDLAISSLPVIRTSGSCPQVLVVSGATDAVIGFDFKDGCENAATGGVTVSGQAQIGVTRATSTLEIDFKRLVIDGKSVDGTFTVTLTRDSGGVSLVGEITEAISTDTVGTVTGTITIDIRSTGQITIESAEVTLDDGTTQRSVTLDDLVIDPTGNGSFVSEGGTATFQSGATTLVVSFQSTTPQSGVVSVSVGGATAQHTLAGF